MLKQGAVVWHSNYYALITMLSLICSNDMHLNCEHSRCHSMLHPLKRSSSTTACIVKLVFEYHAKEDVAVGPRMHLVPDP